MRMQPEAQQYTTQKYAADGFFWHRRRQSGKLYPRQPLNARAASFKLGAV